MSRVYAVEEETGKRVLVRIECDKSGCTASIKPNPKISESGWTVQGQITHPPFPGDVLEWFYCPEHS